MRANRQRELKFAIPSINAALTRVGDASKVKLMDSKKAVFFLIFFFFWLVESKSLVLAQISSVSLVSPQPSPGLQAEKRKKIAIQIEEKENQLNQKAVVSMLQGLERLETIARKVESRTKKIETNESAAAKIYPLIEDLKTKMENLKLELGEQAKKTYHWADKPEANWRWEAGQSQLALAADLGNLKDKLTDIRKDLNNILQILLSF